MCLKSIQMTYYEKIEFLSMTKQYIVQSVNRKLLSLIQAAKVFQNMNQNFDLSFIQFLLLLKKRITSDKKYDERRLDILSGLVLVTNALNGPRK